VNVGSLLTCNAIRFPQKYAVVEGLKRVTYRDLNQRVNRLANRLLALDFKKGDTASIHLKNSVEFVEIYFALSKLGVIVVPINWRLKEKELLHIVTHSDSALLFLDETTKVHVEHLKDEMKAVRKIYAGDTASDWYELYEDFLDVDDREPFSEVAEDDVHSICYTSGTTGLPKGVVLTNLNIITGHYMVTSAEFNVAHDDVFLATTPLTQRVGWGKLINSIARGCTLVLIRSFNPEEVMKVLEEEGVTILSIVPTIGRLLLQLPNIESYHAGSLRMFFVTGEAFPPELKKELMVKFPHVKIISYFASTEAAIISSMLHEDILAKPASVGHLLPGVEVRILDDEGKDVPMGEAGEIVTRCGKPGMFSVMKEYYKQPDQTRETIVNGWLRTGDIGRFDEEGYLYIVDRKKDMIISGGFNIYSREVEAVLECNEKVAEVAVVGVPSEKYGEAVKAFVVLKQGALATEDELVDYCKANMASYKKPSRVEFMNSLPRNSVGKVMKYKLREGKAAF
jgi:long-chain acyl-CoA synthetase